MTELEDDTFSGRINWALWRKILTFITPHRRKIAAVILLGFAIACGELAIIYLNGRIIDSARHAQDTHSIYRVFSSYIALVLVFVTCIFAFIRATGRITCDVSYDIRKAAFEHLQHLSFSFYDKKAVGWLMARLTGDVSTLSRVMSWAILDLCWGSGCIIFISAYMLWSNWKLALLCMTILPVLGLVAAWFQKRLLRTSRDLRKANSRTTASYNEALQGIRTTRSMNREHRNLAEFSDLSQEMYSHALKNFLYSALFAPLLTGICLLSVAIALLKGGYDVATTAESRTGFTLGQLVSFLQAATFIQWPIMQLAMQITQILGAQASAERVQSLLDTQPEITDPPPAAAPQLPTTNYQLPTRINTVEFRNVTFGYDPARPILHDFNLTVEAGQSVALVGPTGGGKSTIVSLACRFYQPTSGQVLINGTDYRELPLSWLQSRLGMVLQQPHLFSGTVAENIRYGRLTATDAEVEHAARLAGAHEFISSFADAYKTKVGEGGNRLSTGQKQLISLARAIIADPQIFVMDEATSSVDTQTERAIQTAVDRVLQGRISFVIAHRLSTIKRADLILVISAGRVVEKGNHHELLARKGTYYELYTNHTIPVQHTRFVFADVSTATNSPTCP
jgi:ATP-binding cassette subfamily B protein